MTYSWAVQLSPLIFSLMLPSSCHIHWLRAKKGSFLYLSQCKGVENQKDVGGDLKARLGSQIIKYPCWGGVLGTSKLSAASHCIIPDSKPHHPVLSSALLPVFLTFPSLPAVSHKLCLQPPETHTGRNAYTITKTHRLHNHKIIPQPKSLHTPSRVALSLLCSPSLWIFSQTLTLHRR